MRFATLPIVLALLTGCSGVAYNTTVANTPAGRMAMAQSVIPGTTTDTALITRWGQPTQKIREGAQVAFVYRDMRDPDDEWYEVIPQFGTSERYVIVTFQYGLAVGVVTSDGIACRATFNPRPPNYTFDNPTQVELRGTCPMAAMWGDGPRAGVTPDVFGPGGASRAIK